MPYDLGMCDCDCKCSNNDYKEEEVCSEENENENEYEGSIFTSVYFWIGIFILFIIVAIIYSKSGETEQQLIYAEPTAPNLKTLK